MVYVIHKNGQPLMPTERHGKVRRLLKAGLAKVVKRTPFTIQLLYDTTSITHEVTLGIDMGSKEVGYSVSTEKKELIAGEVELRSNVKKLLDERRMLRRNRRYRKTRYRKARFLNRVKSKKKGWLAPSILQKINSYEKLVNMLKGILPITSIILEVGNFDTQKLENPNIEGKEYQEGEQLGFWNLREYILHRDSYKCQACKGESNDPVLQVHHKILRSKGGTDTPKNLITLCKTCHENYHKGELKYKFNEKQTSKSLKDAAHMNIMKWTVYDRLKENNPEITVSITYGYITKSKRIKLGLEKHHYIDAYCISNNLNAERLEVYYKHKFVRSHNRSLHKQNYSKGGIRKPNVLSKYMFGYQIEDKVKVLTTGEVGYVQGRRKTGSICLKDMDGNIIKSGITYKKLSLLESRSTQLCSLVRR